MYLCMVSCIQIINLLQIYQTSQLNSKYIFSILDIYIPNRQVPQHTPTCSSDAYDHAASPTMYAASTVYRTRAGAELENWREWCTVVPICKNILF